MLTSCRSRPPNSYCCSTTCVYYRCFTTCALPVLLSYRCRCIPGAPAPASQQAASHASIRQHTSALLHRCIPGAPAAASEQAAAHARALHVSSFYACLVVRGRLFRRRQVCLRQHTSACVSVCQHTSACVSIRQVARGRRFRRRHVCLHHSIRQHASAYVRASAYIDRRQHTSA